jgi:hypothetical protein
MSIENTTKIELVEDPGVERDFGGVLQLLQGARDNFRTSSRGLVDQLIVDLMTGWLEKNDQCGVAQDLVDVALFNLRGETIGDVAPFVQGVTEARASAQKEEEDQGSRNLQFFTEQSCTSFESTIFLGSMLSFSNCAQVDIGKFFGTVEENLVNVGLNCLNSFLQPFQRSETCASENFQGYVMDECVKGIVNDNILGHIFKLFLVSPKQTCGCMSSLASVPVCRVDVTADISLDGMMTSKVACLLESQVCNKLEEECDSRLSVLNECLPNLYDINNGEFDCEEVMCNCEREESGLLNYPGRAMELPMSDYCQDHALDNFVGDFIVERYAVFQAKCDAKYLQEPVAPSVAPTIGPPTPRPTTEGEGLSSLVRQNLSTSLNSVVSGVLIALAIAGVACTILVCVVILWRRRRSNGRKVQTVSDANVHAHKRMKRMEDELRRMEEQNYEASRRSP